MEFIWYLIASIGAGIGTGYDGSCGRIMISGGDVTAYGYTTGLSSSAGIGVSCGGDCAGIQITGGDVKANGGDKAAGIGWCDYGGGTGDIVIKPRAILKVVAKSGENMSAPIFDNGSMDMDLTQTSFSSIPSVDIELGNAASDHSDEALSLRAQGLLAGLNLFFG